MCGIAGIVSSDPTLDLRASVTRMTHRLAHRGPDAEGIFCQAPVALGHRRLSILDLSTAANQPFKDPTGRYVIVYNGEVYNFAELRQALRQHYEFRTQTDTEVILAAYLAEGPACLQRLNGMFAFAIWDRQRQELFLARDRLGIKPLYYYEAGGSLVFASELRALLDSGLVKRQLHANALVDYLTYQTVHAPDTLIEGVRMLEAGSYALLRDGVLEHHRFWELGGSSGGNIPQDKVLVQQQVRERLQVAVQRRLVSDVPLGAFLSGGIDSSAVVALMASVMEQPVNTFSVVFEEKDYDESPWSSMVAQKFNTRHTPILLKPSDFLEALPEALLAMDSPSGDGINSYVVSKVTRAAGITVALSGLGGDELFAGYPVFRQWSQLNDRAWFWKVPQFLRAGTGQLARALLHNHKSDRLQELLALRELDFAQAYPVFRKRASKPVLAQLNDGLPLGHNAVANLLEAQAPQLKHASHLSQVSIGEISTYTQNVLLRDTDQMSMAHALEVRVPFFDHELVEYVLAIPDALKYPHAPKQLLVDALGGLLPSEVVHRPKMGFVFPWEHWLRNELKPLGETAFQRLAQRSIFQAAPLLQLWQRFLAEDKKISWLNMWSLIVLDHWLDKHDIT